MPNKLKVMTIEQVEILDELRKREAALVMIQLELAKKHPELCKARYKVNQTDVQQMQNVPEDALYGLDRTSCMPLLPILSKSVREVLSNGVVDPVIFGLVLDVEAYK